MTESEEIEEILLESHSYGLRIEVMEEASKIMGSNPRMRKVDAYQEAFSTLIKE